MMDKRKAYENKLDSQLKEWSAQLAALRSKADKAKADAKSEYYQTIETLQRTQNEAAAKLSDLKTAGDEAWADLRKGAERAWADMQSAYRDARTRFK